MMRRRMTRIWWKLKKYKVFSGVGCAGTRNNWEPFMFFTFELIFQEAVEANSGTIHLLPTCWEHEEKKLVKLCQANLSLSKLLPIIITVGNHPPTLHPPRIIVLCSWLVHDLFMPPPKKKFSPHLTSNEPRKNFRFPDYIIEPELGVAFPPALLNTTSTTGGFYMKITLHTPPITTTTTQKLHPNLDNFI